MDYTTIVLGFLAFGSFSVAEKVLSYLPEGLNERSFILPVAVGVGAVSAVTGILFTSVVPPLITTFCVSLILSTLILFILEKG